MLLDQLYMGRTRTGEKRHLIERWVIRDAVNDKAELAPALCKAQLATAEVHNPRWEADGREWVIPYAAHWDDHGLCRHCRGIAHRLPEVLPTKCSVIGCERIVGDYVEGAFALYWCGKHAAMVGEP